MIQAALALVLATTCGKLPGRGHYCVTEVTGGHNPDVVYFFHGLGGNEHTWTEDFGFLYPLWQSQGMEPPTVVSISYGKEWFVNATGSHLASRITDRVIPWIEGRLGLPAPGGRRILAGRSMGGMNAAYLSEFRPDLFQKVLLMSPALLALSPHASGGAFADYIQRTGADPKHVFWTVAAYRILFPTQRAWLKASPLELHAESLAPGAPEFLVMVGDHDPYGFQEGSLAFSQMLATEGVTHEWELMAGADHWAVDQDRVAAFLARPTQD
jgi:enterochelin esterase-like enzyme